MNDKRIKEEYFDWLYSIIADRRVPFRDLCFALFNREFVYAMPLDGNRYEDGISLRYHFGRDKHIPDATIAAVLDVAPCSVFEMMVALAYRCEENIMYDSDVGDRTSEWFHVMLKSLGLYSMDDRVGIDERYFNIVIDRFLERRYEPNGKGGLFLLKHCEHDLRKVEIWYQAMWYLTEEEGEFT